MIPRAGSRTIFRRIQKTAWQPAEPRYRSSIRIIGYGVLAQLVEHHNGIVGVSGSSPLCSTTFRKESCVERGPQGHKGTLKTQANELHSLDGALQIRGFRDPEINSFAATHGIAIPTAPLISHNSPDSSAASEAPWNPEPLPRSSTGSRLRPPLLHWKDRPPGHRTACCRASGRCRCPAAVPHGCLQPSRLPLP